MPPRKSVMNAVNNFKARKQMLKKEEEHDRVAEMSKEEKNAAVARQGRRQMIVADSTQGLESAKGFHQRRHQSVRAPEPEVEDEDGWWLSEAAKAKRAADAGGQDLSRSTRVRHTIYAAQATARKTVITVNELAHMDRKTLRKTTKKNCKKLIPVLQQFIQRVSISIANSSFFSVLTTILTFYALFGDDVRLALTEKKDDWAFDMLTVMAMIVFSTEIIACSIGKPGYVFGFFFWLDILSTTTLIFDVSSVSEALFGDSVSSQSAAENDAAGESGGGSAEAARAGRMSRAGTKAGRIVRLVRLIRLVRIIKLYKKSEPGLAHPGYSWDEDDDDEPGVSESAVSKKLSDMTTRRVIMLVLMIMLSLPLFTLNMYGDELRDTAQQGADLLMRRWCDGMKTHFPIDSSTAMPINTTAEDTYLASVSRKMYEDDFWMYVFYHNWFCDETQVPPDSAVSPADSFGKLFYIGVSPPNGQWSKYVFPAFRNQTADQNLKWRGDDWRSYQGGLPMQAQDTLRGPFHQMQTCLHDTMRGASLVLGVQPNLDCPEKLRFNERAALYPTMMAEGECDSTFVMFVFDRREGSRMEAALNAFQTCFVCFALGFGALAFSKDANRLVLRPIEKMISKLERIRSNPLEAMRLGPEEAAREALETRRKALAEGVVSLEVSKTMDLLEDAEVVDEVSRQQLWLLKIKAVMYWVKEKLNPSGSNTPEPMETVVLEKTITKIGSLLALSFGEIGADIIGCHMQASDSSQLNAMRKGTLTEAVFVHCAIKNFSDVNEILGEYVVVFVNRVAAIVHSIATEYHGFPNTNLGSSFFLVWRLPEDEVTQQRLASLALACTEMITARMAKSAYLAEYEKHAKLLKRMPLFKVRLSFGLHCGSAIEGAIGSEFKIDTPYLGPHRDLALRLSSVCREYGTAALASQAFQEKLCRSWHMRTREIDCVHLQHPLVASAPGKSPAPWPPFKIYALDLDDWQLKPDKEIPAPLSKYQLLKSKLERNGRMRQFKDSDHDFLGRVERDLDIVAMRSRYTNEFLHRYSMAFRNYEAGEWDIAKDMMEACDDMLESSGGDGPSKTILAFMAKHDFQAPLDWSGSRLLPERRPPVFGAPLLEREMLLKKAAQTTKRNSLKFCITDAELLS